MRSAAPASAALLRGEYAVLRRLDLPGIARPLALEGPNEAPTLVLEDAGPEDLQRRLARGPLSLEEFFAIAIALADTCARIHERRVVHGAISPAHVVLGAGGQVTLIHFVDAAELTSLPDAVALENLQALPWISPEQTGRMSRFVDQRSDLYSLGATCYAMLTGGPPFHDADPLALVHAHLARSPVPVAVANPHVPEALSDIVQKLLAKMPERRYQSAECLAEDLREARRRFLATGVIEPFELGRLELARRLPLPERLYGRERELAVLLDVIARASAGATEMVLLAGNAGIGKTALADAVRGAVSERSGWFVSGKLDLRAANVPYASVIEALRALARLLRAEPEERRGMVCAHLQSVLGARGRVLVELCPELGEIFDGAPELPPSTRSRRRTGSSSRSRPLSGSSPARTGRS